MTDGSPRDRYEALLSLVQQHVRTLRELFRSRSLKLSTKGTFAELVIFFTWKQEDHADAILTLGKHRDAQLIARSMVEGLCQLKWAANDPANRPERWRLFTWIHDWRLMQRNARFGRVVRTGKRLEIEQGIKDHGHLFEKGRPGRRRKPGRDPYVQHWSGKSVNHLCTEVNGQTLYDWAYTEFSDWHHWSPGGVLKALKTTDRTISFAPPTAHQVLGAFAVAFQCLFETMELANDTFKLGLEADLDEIRNAYLRDLTPTAVPEAPDTHPPEQ